MIRGEMGALLEASDHRRSEGRAAIGVVHRAVAWPEIDLTSQHDSQLPVSSRLASNAILNVCI
jgi:hypothetical protein